MNYGPNHARFLLLVEGLLHFSECQGRLSSKTQLDAERKTVPEKQNPKISMQERNAKSCKPNQDILVSQRCTWVGRAQLHVDNLGRISSQLVDGRLQ